jgi:pimeloyl-ACP methyl ester carboxylesterase
MSAAIVYVHGLWMPGAEGWLLQRRLAALLGWRCHTFRYASVRTSMHAITVALRETIAALAAERVHLVGHSLGGIVILRCLERYPVPPGRVVFLGTPVRGSRAALKFGRSAWGQALLGQNAAAELLRTRERSWPVERDLGLIAGSRAMGFGRLVTRYDEPNDGTVAVSETRLPGARAHITLPVTHTGMLLSARVARETAHFLARGTFSAAAA